REPDHEAAQRLRVRLSTEREARLARQRGETPDVAHPAPDDGFEPDHATLIPNRPVPDVLPDDEDEDRMTLTPERTAPYALDDDDEPDHVTLVPPRPDPRVFADEELDGVTLVPARPAPNVLEDDDD